MKHGIEFRFRAASRHLQPYTYLCVPNGQAVGLREHCRNGGLRVFEKSI